ncbi:MAG: glycogen-binding domain-containing protein [Candidatus Eisenbacteria bacterium]|nr:glycogen-binding domain-containing protein [Candidatus Eisenbacteria bacterium]
MKKRTRRSREKANKRSGKTRGKKPHRKSGMRSGGELPGSPMPGGPFPVGFLLALVIVLAVVPYCTAAVQKTALGYEFTYEDPGAASVSVAGGFNNWSTTTNPMTKDGKGVWGVAMALGPGKYEYKFVVNGSSWIADPDNPIVVGDNGNSQIEIDAEGNLVEKPTVRKFSNTSLGSRVAINGYFRATYPAQSDVAGDERLRLTRPEHEFNMDVNVKASDNVGGSVRIQFDTGTGTLQETQGSIYSGHLNLLTSAFDIKGYYNEELLSFDEPLELLGHEDLRGTIREEHLDYGRGTQGAVFTAHGLGVEGTMMYTDVYDFDRFNNPSTYDDTGTDVMGARLTKELRSGLVRAGLSWLRLQNGWWVDFVSGANGSADIDSFKLATGSSSDWFELGTADQTLATDVRFMLPRKLRCTVEYAYWSWSAAWDVGNKERLEGTSTANGSIDVPIGEDSGHRVKALLERDVNDNLKLSISHEIQRYKAMKAGDLYVDFRRAPFADPSVNTFTGIGSISGFSVAELPLLPERNNDITELDLGFVFKNLSGLIEVDRTRMERAYSVADSVSPTVPSTQTNERWRVAPGFSLGLLGGRLTLGLDYEYIQNNPEGQFFSSFSISDQLYASQCYDTRELIVSGKLELTQRVATVWDVRRMVYAANKGQEPSPEDSYVSPYVALVYAPSPSIELRLGYHVNPVYYKDAPLEGRGNGRQIWRDAYMWEHGVDVFAAERALSDVTMITLMGVINF